MDEFDYLISGEMVRIQQVYRYWKAWVFSPRKREWQQICGRSIPESDGTPNFLASARKAYAEEVAADMPRMRAAYPWMY